MRGLRRESRVATAATFVLLAAAGGFAQEKVTRELVPPANDNPEPIRRIVVSIPCRKLALLEGKRVIKIWNTAVGKESTPSPAGTYTIINRVSQPTYYQSGKVVPPGLSNPVGTRWMGLSLKGFGIHGTNKPGSIGRKASHGCIRMKNRDVEELFELVKVGDVVELHRDNDDRLAGIFETDRSPEAGPDSRKGTAGTLGSSQ